MKLKYIIVYVSDMKRSVSFYKDILDLPLGFESSHWTEFTTEGVIVALHKSDGPNPDENSGKEMVAGTSFPGLSVTDLDSIHKKMMMEGVSCLQEPKETFGARIAKYLDPDGLIISVSEESET